MKKTRALNILGGIVYLAIIVASVTLLIVPGVSNLKKANDIKILTNEEKSKLVDEINQKYVPLEKEINDKYATSTEEINAKYKKQEQEINEKYKEKEKTIDSELATKNAAQDKEFRSHAFSEKFYALGNEIDALRDEKTDLMFSKQDDIHNNDLAKDTEISNIQKNKASDLIRLNENKNNEIANINNQSNDKAEFQMKGIAKIIAGCIIILIPLMYIIYVFNRLTHLRNRVKEQWSGVDVYLKQRTDLIPNIVEAIKGYSKHEKNTLTKVTEARNQALNATTREEEISANKDLSNAINKIFFLQEDYPELKADGNFMGLQNNLREIENNISYARKNYNKAVLNYKNKIEMFPSNIIAGIFNFQPELFFTVDEDEKENPNISFK